MTSTTASPLREVLLVYPRFASNNLLSFEYMAPLYPGKRAVMPPLGLLTIGALLRDAGFAVRLIDENVEAVTEQDLAMADIVALSGMHPQRSRIHALLRSARRLGKVTVLGGPSVSICPEYYPEADLIHIGEIGDGTCRLIEDLRALRGRPAAQIVYRTNEKTPLGEQPLPALELLRINAYLVMPLQFSVGCPYTCEFCDIPMIYGRVARVKPGERVVRELEAIYDAGFVGTILFVDDNLIANRKALRGMLRDVIAWQRARCHPYPLTAEATLNVSRDEEILAALNAARFTHLFVGVESPDPETLRHISKRQNTQDPVLESIARIAAHGIEVIMGMIFGFDTDTRDTGRAVTRFVGESHAPIVYFNLLSALPKTALWDRMVKEGRLREDEHGDTLQAESLLSCVTSNVRFRLPNDVVEEMLCDTIRQVYSPEEVFRRFTWNAEHVYGRQIQGIPPTETPAQRRFVIGFTLGTLGNVVWRIGVRAAYRRHFWRFLGRLITLRWRGRIKSVLEVLLRVTPNAHHLIRWGEVLLAGKGAVRSRLVQQGTHREEPAVQGGAAPQGDGPRPAQATVVRLRARSDAERG